ncbi:MAG: hydrogenase maturation nickel metallochaperone HypA [bacterium]|nr:hydrogenase maturation nickel metallochaperone HypA [bacterium]
MSPGAWRMAEEYNPLEVKCGACGAPAEFDIVSQDYHCGHCGEHTSLYESLHKIDDWQKERAASIHKEMKQAKAVKMHCGHCGADVTIPEGEAINTCAFCGAKMVRAEYLETDSFPSVIIPFYITKEEAQKRLKDWISKNKFRREAKALSKNITKLEGYYLPYEIVKGYATTVAIQNLASRKYNVGGYMEGIAINTSEKFDNMLLDDMEPFDWSGARSFDFGYIAGQKTKMRDASDKTVQQRIDTEVEEGFVTELEKVFGSKDLTLHTSHGGLITVPALLPVYVLVSGMTKAVINGQTGRIAVTSNATKIVSRWYTMPILLSLLILVISETFMINNIGELMATETGPLWLLYLKGMFYDLFAVSGMITLVAAIVFFCIYSDGSNVEKRVIYSSPKVKAERKMGKLTFTEGANVLPDTAAKPCFYENINGKTVPVKVKFYSLKRVLMIILTALFVNCLPIIIAVGMGALVSFVNGNTAFLARMNLWYNGIWEVLALPITVFMVVNFASARICDFPLFEVIGAKNQCRVQAGAKLRGWKLLPFQDALKIFEDFGDTPFLFFTPPGCLFWLIPFMLFGTISAIITG